MTNSYYGAKSTDLLLMGSKIPWVFTLLKMLWEGGEVDLTGWYKTGASLGLCLHVILDENMYVGKNRTSEPCCFWGSDRETIYQKEQTNQTKKKKKPTKPNKLLETQATA